MQIENGRLTATEKRLDRAGFDAIAEELGVNPGLAVKVGDQPVAAMNIVDVAAPVVTINTQDGSVQQDSAVAQPGDAIMMRLNKDGTPKVGETGELDQWVVEAPWGGAQEISEGVLQYSITTDEVYLNEGDAFDATFDVKTASTPVDTAVIRVPLSFAAGWRLPCTGVS